MLRSCFFSVGLFVTLWGVTFLFVDKLVLKDDGVAARSQGFRGMFSAVGAQNDRDLNPPDWAAFSLMSVGAVTMLYAVALPRKSKA